MVKLILKMSLGQYSAVLNAESSSSFSDSQLCPWSCFDASHSPYVFSVIITTPEVKVKVLVSQWCWTLCDLMDYSLPSSSAHGILQARVLEWVTISFSRESSWPRDRTWVSLIAGRFFTVWTTRKHLGVIILIVCIWIHSPRQMSWLVTHLGQV